MKKLSRRTILRGAGVTLALPMLEAMRLRPVAAETSDAESAKPTRMAFIYIPNGVIENTWTPDRVGKDYDLKPALEPLRQMRDRVTVVSGLDRTFAGGTGVHAQCGACWLSSSPPDESLDGAFPTNTTVDRFAAAKIGTTTLFPSLELSCNDHTNNKETKYFESISWYGPGYAASVEKNPRAVFERMFGNPGGDAATKSVLDAVLDDADALHRRLGIADRRKFDEYLESVRATETRIQRAEDFAKRMKAPPLEKPEGIPTDRGQYIRLMGDLTALAFQLDLTRVATLVIDPERWDTPRMYDGVFDRPENHHVLTHTKGDEAVEKLVKIDTFHVQQYAYLLEKLASIQEGEESLLDRSVVCLGSGLSDGRVHSYKNLPLLIGGSGGGRLVTGEHIRYDGERPLADLWLTLLQQLGVSLPRFADSTGTLKEIVTG